MIYATEAVDENGWYVLRANGHSARTVAGLAEKLGIPAAELVVQPGPRRPPRFDNRVMPQGLDFDPF